MYASVMFHSRGTTQSKTFVPEGTSLTVQLNQFQRNRRRLAFVVDEYGDSLGCVTLEDIRIDLGVPPRVGPGVASLRAGATVLAEGVVRGTDGLPAATALPRSSRTTAGSGMLPGRIALRAIPYARWANRAGGAMRVWIPVDEEVSTT